MRRGRLRFGAHASIGVVWLSCADPHLTSVYGYNAQRRVESARLYGSIAANKPYFVDMLIGSPPQLVSLLADTGSPYTSVPCSPASCQSCKHHISQPFVIDKSTSATWLPCDERCGSCHEGKFCAFKANYFSGTWFEGVWFKDVIRLGDAAQDNPPAEARLGCMVDTSQAGFIKSKRITGIMGLGLPDPESGQPTILRELFADRKDVNPGVFSLCFAAEGGKMSVGGFEPEFHVVDAEVAWIPIVTSTLYFQVVLQAMSVDAQQVAADELDFGRTILDSGTMFTTFPRPVYDRLTRVLLEVLEAGSGELESKCGSIRRYETTYTDGSLSGCWEFGADSWVDNPSCFPTISMTFPGGILLKWPPSVYMYPSEEGIWCEGWIGWNNTVNNPTILGNSWMINRDIIFDLNDRRVGIVDATCPVHRDYFTTLTTTKQPKPDPGDLWASEFWSIWTTVAELLLVAGIGSCLCAAAGGWVYHYCMQLEICKRHQEARRGRRREPWAQLSAASPTRDEGEESFVSDGPSPTTHARTWR